MSDAGPALSVRVRLGPRSRAGGRGLDVAFETQGEPVALMGPSGAGKSTLLRCIAGALRPDEGRVAWDGQPWFDAARGLWVPPHRRPVALVFQSLALFPHLSVWRNVAYGMRHVPRSQRRERALQWLRLAHVEALADRSVEQLSGGEAQRVALVRALAREPSLLLLDEPFSALDRPLRAEIVALLATLLDRGRTSLLLVTHDEADARAVASRLLRIHEGRLVGDEWLTAPVPSRTG
ncbi:MAG: ATP-binding cassette domain-containing protein [Myxococcota bacterium]|nr:ATP-binding cassette domain-containing protein [Myxococcota bacterium]